MELQNIITSFKEAFKDENVKKAVLQKEWYDRNTNSGIDCTGFCYAASEVIYRLDGGKSKWKKIAISEKKWEVGRHCFLINKLTNEILDITAEQYTEKNIQIPYDKGVAGGFRTKDFTKSVRTLAIKSGLINF